MAWGSKRASIYRAFSPPEMWPKRWSDGSFRERFTWRGYRDGGRRWHRRRGDVIRALPESAACPERRVARQRLPDALGRRTFPVAGVRKDRAVAAGNVAVRRAVGIVDAFVFGGVTIVADDSRIVTARAEGRRAV